MDPEARKAGAGTGTVASCPVLQCRALENATLSFTGKRWRLREGVGASSNDVVRTLANKRGIALEDEATDTSMRFPDAEKAAERVLAAAARSETIGIFGDYDCDGITGAALLIRMLRRRGQTPVVRLPHRSHDGYGLKPHHVQAFADAGVRLLITVDTGITSHAALTLAQSLGIDAIVLDHHSLPDNAPPAFAILHPALAPGFPEPWPSAAGVAFAFVAAIEAGAWDDRDEDLALAMIGTVADLVPLLGANRTLVRAGLAALERLRDVPLATFAARTRTGSAPLTSTDIAFRIAPRINAAGRIADPMIALHALLEGGEYLRDLETLNVLRQEETAGAIDHALQSLDNATDPFVCVADPSYQAGIIGLIAGKMTERFGRPSMAVSMRSGECVASLRSIQCYSIIDGLRRHSGLFTSFGGHAQAAGCSFHPANLPTIREALSKDVSLHVSPADLIPTLPVDATLAPGMLSIPFVRSLSALEPFGQGNPEPQFLIENVRLSSVRTVGQHGKHLQAFAAGHKLIAFGHGNLIDRTQGPIDLLCRLGIDTWNGRGQTQLMVQDMRVAHRSSLLVGSLHEKEQGTRNE